MKTSIKKLSAAAGFFFSTVLMISCQKEAMVPTEMTSEVPTEAVATNETVTNSSTDSSTPNTNEASTTEAGITVLPNYSIYQNFDKYSVNAPYSYTNAVTDFKKIVFWEGQSRSFISSKRLATRLTKNTLGGAGGVIANMDVLDASEYQLEFRMLFHPDFDFSWGGKVGFGFMLGDGFTGGGNAAGGTGGSARLMWYKNTSAGRVFIKPYLYHKDQPGTWGDDKGKTFPATGSIQKGVWYTVKMYIKSNTGYNTDGRIRMTINGVTLIDQPMRWTTNDSKRLINKVCFENFRGGGESYWMSPKDGVIYFDNVSWKALKY